MIFNQKLIIDLMLTDKFIFFRAAKIDLFLSESTILRPRELYDQYCTNQIADIL